MKSGSYAGTFPKSNTGPATPTLHVTVTKTVDLVFSASSTLTSIIYQKEYVMTNLFNHMLARAVWIEGCATVKPLTGSMAGKTNSSNSFAQKNRCRTSHPLVLNHINQPKKDGIQ